MRHYLDLLKRMQIRQIITIFLVGILLIVTVACSGANTQGANPHNTPVQAGGANNPYQNGGDNYTRMSTDSNVTTERSRKEQDQANLLLNPQFLVAAKKEAEMLYPGAETPGGRVKKEAELPIITQKEFQHPEPGGLIQREPDLGVRVQERIESVRDSVEKASGFLQNKADEASNRPELQKNPSVGK
ncbi:DUF6658 family protein [Cronbergia sp. UHCC 0137]|uniref:DUF6658 family protein n=1 Tax=Cronbergia sp. UHCC 0137 TaxID=3110239 RepID=UPI002B20A2FA|nr:DUF6658 family protein [Cronbergia sp. UHCC 0137]MEA5619872.1 DUF6658 family protein [Cronbergia sp. UHCC 0137]